MVIDHYWIFPDALKCNACSDGEKWWDITNNLMILTSFQYVFPFPPGHFPGFWPIPTVQPEFSQHGHQGLKQPIMLGIHRSDYMLHEGSENSEPRFLQVELNTIASSMGAHALNVPWSQRFSREYPLAMTNIAIENDHLQWVFPLKTVIFHSYVKLPEGKLNFHPIPPGDSWLLSLVLASPILGVIPFMSIYIWQKTNKISHLPKWVDHSSPSIPEFNIMKWVCLKLRYTQQC